MKKCFWVCLALAGVLLGCSDEDHKLEGKWQMQRMEVNGEVLPVDTVYYNFQNSLFMYQIANSINSNMQAYGYKQTDDGDKLALEIDVNQIDMAYFYEKSGWTEPLRVFTIDKLSGSKLILSDNGRKYYFRKF